MLIKRKVEEEEGVPIFSRQGDTQEITRSCTVKVMTRDKDSVISKEKF